MRGLLLLAAGSALVPTCTSGSDVLLQANARGMACAVWNNAGTGVPKDCVWHSPPGSSQPAGSPWFGEVDPATGASTAIPGVTQAIGRMQSVHGNFVAPDPAKPRHLLGFANPNYTYYATSMQLPGGSGVEGSVDPVSKAGEAVPAWVEAASPGCMLAWSYLETVAGGSLNVTEALRCVDPVSLQATLLWSNSSSPTEGSVPPAYFGAERAVDTHEGVLYTQSETQDLGVFDVGATKARPRLETGGRRITCLHYDPTEKRLGGVVLHAAAGSAAASAELVSIDTATGSVTTRLSVHDFPPPLGGLSLFYVDASTHPGDMFSPVSRPACSFDATTGVLAFLLVEIDPDVKPAFANKAMYVSVLNTRNPTAPSTPAKIDFPFVAAGPAGSTLGNRTWRATMPGLSFL